MTGRDRINLSSNAQEQALTVPLRHNGFPEQFLWNRISDDARQIAFWVDGACQGQESSKQALRVDFERRAPSVARDRTEKVGSYDALNDKVTGWERRLERIDQELASVTGEEERGLKRIRSGVKGAIDRFGPLRNDMREGVAIAVQRRVNMAISAGRQDDPMLVAVRSGNGAEIDRLLGEGVVVGIGEEIVDRLVTNPDLAAILSELHNWLNREGRVRGPKGMTDATLVREQQKMGDRIRSFYEKDGVNSGEVATVEEYYFWALEDLGVVETPSPVVLGGEVGGEGGGSMLTELRKLTAAFDRFAEKGGAMPAMPAFLAGGEGGGTGDPMAMARAMEMMRGVEGKEQLTGTSMDEVFNWATKIAYELARKPLGFAGSWWQAYMPYLEDTVTARFMVLGKERVALGGKEMSEREINDGVATVRAVMMTEMQLQMILHADGGLGTKGGYLQYCPPPGMVPEYQWDAKYLYREGRRKGELIKLADVVGQNPAVLMIEREIMSRFEHGGDDARELVKKMATPPGSLNELAEEMAKEVFGNEGNLATLTREHPGVFDEGVSKQLARLAIAHFAVEVWPNLVMWACPRAIEEEETLRAVREGRAGLVKVRDAEGNLVDVQRKFDWADTSKMRLGRRVLDRFGTRGDVWIYNPKIGTGIDHPFVALQRPVDVNRYKKTWNEEVWSLFEEGVQMFAVRKWKWNNDPTKGPVGEKEFFAKPSDMSAKDVGRYDDMLSAFVGGPQAGDLDDFKNLEVGFDKMANMMVGDPDGPEICGRVAARVIMTKVMALMSERNGTFGANLRAALAIERSSVPKEMQDALATMAGSGADSGFGQIKEAIARLGFNFYGLREINQAVAMLMTDVSDPVAAEKALQMKKAAMILNSILQGVQELDGSVAPKKK